MPVSYLRKATIADLPAITHIIDDAKMYLNSQNIDQWQDGYPDQPTLKQDLEDGITYVLIINGTIAGTAALHQGIDIDYLKIEDGSWLNGINARYTAIHRIALAQDFRGQHLSGKLMSGLITISRLLGFKDIRIDTHPDNSGMQHVITSNGFEKRGKVYLHDGKDLRYAYQLLID